MERRKSVLIVEDDKAILRLLRDVFEHESLAVHEATAGRPGLVEAGSRRPDLVVLDLGLPDIDGKEFLREFRCFADTPVLVLSARGAETEKVAALDCGADDYLTKPFGVPELLARLRALMRRHEKTHAEHRMFYRFGEVLIDLGGRTVYRRREIVHLTQVEFALLAALVRAEGRIVVQSQLLRQVWGAGHSGHTHYLRIYMAHLRKKLEVNPGVPEFLITEIGVGCRCICEQIEERQWNDALSGITP